VQKKMDETEHQPLQRPPDEDDGRCYMVCCACELPCGRMTRAVRFCAYLVFLTTLGGMAGGIAAANTMSGEPNGNICKYSWAPNCLAGKVLAVVFCAVLVGVSIIGLYCCCQNCNGEIELSQRKGLVECFKCKAMLFVPPVALHFHCAKCFAHLSLTSEKPCELPDDAPEPVSPKKPLMAGHRVSEIDSSKDIIRSFILKADLNHDGNLSAAEIETYLKNTAGTEEQAQAMQAIKVLQSVAAEEAAKKPAATEMTIVVKKEEETSPKADVAIEVATTPTALTSS